MQYVPSTSAHDIPLNCLRRLRVAITSLLVFCRSRYPSDLSLPAPYLRVLTLSAVVYFVCWGSLVETPSTCFNIWPIKHQTIEHAVFVEGETWNLLDGAGGGVRAHEGGDRNQAGTDRC